MELPSYNSAIRSLIPGSFVPDLAPGKAAAPKSELLPVGEVGATSFRDTVKSMLAGVNDKLVASNQSIQDIATGKSTDMTKTVTSVEEANLAMQFTIAVRNKLLAAYQEIDRMQI